MANLFKTRFVPNPDGTNSTTAIMNANTAFVHTYIGDDLTGDGTREYPFKSAFKANQKSSVEYIVFRGVINEAFDINKGIIGDDINQCILTSNFYVKIKYVFRLSFDKFIGFINSGSFSNIIVKNTFSGVLNGNSSHCLCLNEFICTSQGEWKNVTTEKYKSTDLAYGFGRVSNYIIIKEFNIISTGMTIHRFCVFSSKTVFKYNGNVVNVIFTNDSSVNIQLLRNAYVSAGMSISQAEIIFYKDSFDNETCKIIKEAKDGGTHPNIFNRYNPDGTVSDYTLNPDPLNEALHASDLGGYVGCFSAAISANNWGSIINVSADGSDDVVAGQLLQSDFTFSHASGQTWNRIKSAVEKIEKPGKFKGLNCDTLDGTPWGDYFGKKQNLVSDVALNPTEALEANTRYKVANTADNSNYAAVIYKGGQYPPDFFFVTDATNFTFDLLNAGSGSVVRKVFATPLESGEIIPFDDYTTPSAFPRFSAPFMGDVLMLFHKIGVNINQPVLFSEVTNDKIAYYANWAVTNADQEFVTLAADTVNYYYKIPILTYYKKELNAHFDANYDQ